MVYMLKTSYTITYFLLQLDDWVLCRIYKKYTKVGQCEVDGLSIEEDLPSLLDIQQHNTNAISKFNVYNEIDPLLEETSHPQIQPLIGYSHQYMQHDQSCYTNSRNGTLLMASPLQDLDGYIFKGGSVNLPNLNQKNPNQLPQPISLEPCYQWSLNNATN